MIKKSALTNLTLPMAELAFDQCLTLAGAVVEMIEQDDGRFTVTVVWDDTGAVLENDELDAFERQPPSVPTSPGAARLGSLSSHFESNGKPGAIGFDTNGGFSYGEYQIAARTGTLQTFLTFLGTAFPQYLAPLQNAGGLIAGSKGDAAFKNAWRQLAATQSGFSDAQYTFIKSTHYDVFAKKLLTALGLNLSNRTVALRDVAWSVAVQHGASNQVFANALADKDVAAMSDSEIITAVYAERSKLDKYFSSSTQRVKLSLAARFNDERARALAMLAG
ncbi:hypothetical protein ACSFBX_10265 [Variovorax sp. RB2P76]|uniref:VgrG-related protein n=1 Tax=Variovorax sp. RB2P76 TaxID=3443736 RepID=UPI003F44A6D1